MVVKNEIINMKFIKITYKIYILSFIKYGKNEKLSCLMRHILFCDVPSFVFFHFCIREAFHRNGKLY